MRVNLAEQAPVGHGVEIYEDVGVRARCREGTSALDERVAAGVGVGIDEDELAGHMGERREKCIGFGVGVAMNGDRMPGGQERGRRERERRVGIREPRGRAASDRRRWSSEGAPA